jgi:bacteriophage N4 adsorption protein B
MTFTEFLLVLLAVAYVICAVDDLVFDVTYWTRRLRGRAATPVRALEDLEAVPQRKAAIVTAAWHEADVIGRMAIFNAGAIDYGNYDVIIGTYPNDADTQGEVDRAAGVLPNVIKVVTGHPGPTSKADCLNAVLAEIIRREEASGELYDFVLMHDPEDVIHPLELKLANYHFETFDVHMLQLPVLSLPVPWWRVTAGTYMDEFAEFYTKDMFVRQWLTGFVPSAGVATAIRRDVLEILSEETNGRAFAINSLTEDYDVGLELAVGGYTTRVLAERVRVGRNGSAAEELVATRAPFPLSFRTSVRQRTRWTIGLVFQSLYNWGWPGTRALRWLLAHDRKAPLSFGVVAAGYVLVLWVLAYELLRRLALPGLSPLFSDARWVRVLFAIGLGLMANRLLQRAIASARIYGLPQGLLAILRQPWGNLIYIVVTFRAAFQFYGARRRGTQVTWDKTAHTVPEYVASRVQLGEQLIVSGKLSPQHLMLALREQSRSHRLLGEILVDQGAVSRADLDQALAAVDARRRVGP